MKNKNENREKSNIQMYRIWYDGSAPIYHNSKMVLDRLWVAKLYQLEASWRIKAVLDRQVAMTRSGSIGPSFSEPYVKISSSVRREGVSCVICVKSRNLDEKQNTSKLFQRHSVESQIPTHSIHCVREASNNFIHFYHIKFTPISSNRF